MLGGPPDRSRSEDLDPPFDLCGEVPQQLRVMLRPRLSDEMFQLRVEIRTFSAGT
jgi:hypothetical protein